MKKNKWFAGKISFALILFVLCVENTALAQCLSHSIIDCVYLKAKSYEPEIRSAILTSKFNTGKQNWDEEKIDSIRLVPIIKLSFDDSDKNFAEYDFHEDSSSTICAIPYPSKRVYLYDVKSKKLGLKGESGKEMNELVQKSIIKSKKPIFTFFFNVDQYQNDVVCFPINNCSFNFVTVSSSQILSIKEVLKTKYGASDTYFEYREKERIKDHIGKEARKLFADTTLKNNWHFYSSYFPNDTITCLSLLVNDVTNSVKLTLSNKSRLKKEILSTLSNKPPEFSFIADQKTLTYYKYYGLKPIINFMDTDITAALALVLNKEQMKTYKIAAEISYMQNTIIENSLSRKFINDNTAKKDFVKKNIKRTDLDSFSFKDEDYKAGYIVR
ncbi:MAG: hypothetical protein WC623_06040 [Pedobacter sp.]|uniref:hypothetical protein n=1 Tax=Pedobacter sp. TaxID=1411316 RepID=UPI0035651F15